MIVTDEVSGAPVELTGAPVVGIWHRTLVWAVDELVKLGPDQLNSLKVRAGEHLAAILTTSFMGVAPFQVDTHGGPDLLFDLSEKRPQFLPIPQSALTAAFEVKSMRGSFREFDSEINRTNARGGDASGRSFLLRAQTAREILTQARPLLDSAQTGLASKVVNPDATSRNIFLIVHPFDVLAVELEHPVLGPFLPDLGYLSDIDSVWVLWVPDHLTMWSREKKGWTDLMFDAMGPDEIPPQELSPLQAAEVRFLSARGDKDGSPYLFKIRDHEP
ncbi:hypothetical protein [Archangium violaceum]|uniref:hypothetical protein n=1 Tax=Archangium violaceum TaxID=83451 RepID=UPI0036D7BC4B